MNTIGVVGGQEADDAIEILTALAYACGLDIRRAQVNAGSGFAGFIVLGTAPEQAGWPIPKDRPSIRVVTSDAARTDAVIRFNTGLLSPFPFRARSVLTGSVVPEDSPDLPGEVIATADGKPVWMTASVRGLRHDTCFVSRPWIKTGECVFDHLNRSRFMNLLPLIEWLRWICDWREWKQPPLRACFMFDDPNLHATQYGFVNFAQLASGGQRNRYHTSFATVPLDSYYVKEAAAQIFRDNPETLSILIHGNNHAYWELADDLTPKEQVALLRQAVLRIYQLEQKTGVAVSRVMAPPYGRCPVGMMAAMVPMGLESVCVSHGSVRQTNPGAKWSVSLGAFPALVVAGLPVIPRFSLANKPENNILLAAYLSQPIIPVGHHWDLADGTDVLTSAARFINGLGHVAWSDMTTITRTNFRFRIQGSVMRVQAYSRKMHLKVPEGVSELELEAPWLDPAVDCLDCRCSGSVSPQLSVAARPGWRFAVTPGRDVELEVRRTSRNGDLPHALPRTPLSVIARKVLMELRDRAMPHVLRLCGRCVLKLGSFEKFMSG